MVHHKNTSSRSYDERRSPVSDVRSITEMTIMTHTDLKRNTKQEQIKASSVK